jgi:hypothetical protein
MAQDMFGVLIVADMRAMQRFDHFAVYSARDYAPFHPQFLTLLRGTDDRRDLAPLLPELGDIQIGQIIGDLRARPSMGITVLRCDGAQLGDIADGITFRLAVCHRLECEGHIAPVIGVRRRTCRNRPDQIAGLDGVNRRATHTGLAVFGQAARPHPAHFAAHARAANIAGGHRVGTAESGREAHLFSTDDHLLCCGINAVFFGAAFLLCHRVYSPSSILSKGPIPGHGQSGRPA